ncbi:MAG: PDZ domain-containing protein [Gemmatimonadota bacterium]
MPKRATRNALLILAGLWAGPMRPAGAAIGRELPAAGPASRITDVRYEITFDEETARRGVIEVAMRFRTEDAEPVLLSIPAWTPGSYELDNFARHVSGFSAEQAGETIRWDKTDYDTWRVFPVTAGAVTVRFGFEADTLDVGMAWSRPDFAFFNGTNLFPYPEGIGLDFSVTVSVRTEGDWKIATGLTPGAAPGEFVADSYHEVVDMPTFVGRFDLDSARVGDRWYRLATYPEGALAGEVRDRTWDEIREMMPPMAAVFGEVPWETYTIEMVFPESFGGGSALEHRNSHLGIYTPALIGHPILASIVAHETFHAWNVKRLRPAAMVPYRYDVPQPTTLLWVSEGITDYYADLALVRGEIVDADAFYATTAGKIDQVESVPPVSLEDASLSTWIEPTDGTAFVYYPKGSLAGLLLDILIRDGSDNRASLDDVMRTLYVDSWKAGRGFTTADFWRVASRAAGHPLDEFAARHVDGREPLPYRDVLALAGLTLAVDTLHVPFIGVSTSSGEDGARVQAVTPGSSAERAGVQAGDVLLRLGDVDVEAEGANFGAAYRSRYAEGAAGAPLDFVVRRGDETLTLPGELGFTDRVARSIAENPDAGPKETRIRESILRGRTGR